MISLLSEHPVGGLMAVPISDTVKQVNDGAVVSGTLNRKALWRAQTPQMFRYGLLKKALEQAHEERFDMTDEASAIELFGLKPAVVKGSEANIKITFPEDLLLAEFYLEKLSGE
jgi:2-C-methyl-D-erythritol 4-phosphate cytidylyltransferase